MDPIVRYLYERYYQSGVNPEERNYISSHWEEEAQYLLAEPDDSGEINPTSDYYWGCKWKSPIARGIDTAHKFVHFPGLSHKRRIFQLNRLSAKICRRMGLDPTHTVFRQVCTAELLERNWYRVKPEPGGRPRILVIGDGAGVLSGLLKAMFPSCSIVLVDIGKALLYQAFHCQRAYPKQTHMLADGETDLSQADFLYCPTENLHALENLDFDAAVNVASMQEMNADTIARYFDFLRKRLRADNLFYCCNRESKTLVGGEVSEFYNYPWRDEDQVILEGQCPWHRYIVGRPKGEKGPKMLGLRIPSLSYYDGVILHRLATLSVEHSPTGPLTTMAQEPEVE